MSAFTRRSLLLGTGAAVGVIGTRYLANEDVSAGLPVPQDKVSAAGKLVLNDASKLSPTPVYKHITLKEAPEAKLIEVLRKELQEAKSENRPFVVSAARHSMGGQSLAQGGTAITMDQTWLEADKNAGTYRVAAGMRWGRLVEQLDKIGFSPKVMQSNNDFGIASTFCVNAHGWALPYSAFGSTVRSLKLMIASGELITCSRTENTDLFNLTMGGYGLTGAITELDVEMVPNSRLKPTFESMPAKEFGSKFVAAFKNNPKIEMGYGRLDVSIDSFFDEALLVTYEPSGDQSDVPVLTGAGFVSRTSTKVFRRQLNYDRAKNLRWYIEKSVGPMVGSGDISRNTLINEPVVELGSNGPKRTDILHEYFVSPDRFPEFIQACKDVIPSSYQQLLNVTLRYVDTDHDSVLAYATEPRIAAVMLFSQEMSLRGEADMKRMTSALIQRLIDIGGTYYLPYRLHATDEQFQKGYKRATEFVSMKRSFDPGTVFRNALWDRYMKQL